ncbi:hypothetical protein ACH3XW_5110 [Acanthocheilonema viteae]
MEDRPRRCPTATHRQTTSCQLLLLRLDTALLFSLSVHNRSQTTFLFHFHTETENDIEIGIGTTSALIVIVRLTRPFVWYSEPVCLRPEERFAGYSQGSAIYVDGTRDQ